MLKDVLDLHIIFQNDNKIGIDDFYGGAQGGLVFAVVVLIFEYLNTLSDWDLEFFETFKYSQSGN